VIVCVAQLLGTDEQCRNQGSEKPGVQKNPGFKKAQPTGVFGFIGFFGFFYLNDQLGSLLVDLAHQLSFCLDSYFRLSENLPFISYY